MDEQTADAALLGVVTPPAVGGPNVAKEPLRVEVLKEAAKLIMGDRQAEYGTPQVNFRRIAAFWQVLFPERQWTPADVALAMTALKLGRAAQGYKRDTAADLGGYVALWAELSEDEAE